MSRGRLTFFAGILLLALPLLLNGCGNKGALYLPDEQQQDKPG